MEILDEDRIIGMLNNLNEGNPQLGTVTPYFLIRDKEIAVTNNLKELFPNNGDIFVIQNANKLKPKLFYELKVSPGEATERIDHCAWTTRFDYSPSPYKRVGKFAMIISSEKYPDPLRDDGMSFSSREEPEDGFFIKCTNPEGHEVLVGPYNILQSTRSKNNSLSIWEFEIEPINSKLTSNPFEKLSDNPFSVLEYRSDEIPDHCFNRHEKSMKEYLINLNLLVPIPVVKDMMNPKRLFSWVKNEYRRGREKGEDDNEGITQFNKISSFISENKYKPSVDDNIFDQRKDKLSKLTDGLYSDSDKGDLTPVLLSILQSKKGEILIKEYVEKNREKVLKDYEPKEFTKLEDNRVKDLDEEINRLEKEKAGYKDAIDKLKLETK